jgi:4-methyl-5(b-hydroxyethyl)-thiazole monophosphate biosynthesis
VTVAGTQPGPIEASRGVRITPECSLEEASAAPFDMIVLPGGSQGVENLKSHPKLLPLLSEFMAQGKWVGAICAAPSLLAGAGLIRGKQVTSHPSVKGAVAPTTLYTENRVAQDGRVVTSRGPGTAMEFALKLVEILAGKEKVSELKEQLVL